MSNLEIARESILGHAVAFASAHGLKSLSLGGVARELAVPKSRLFDIFPSNDALQLAVLDHAATLFGREVIDAVPQTPGGATRITALFTRWLNWSRSPRLSRSCPFVQASAEGTDLPPLIKAKLSEILDQWTSILRDTVEEAKASGSLRSDLNSDQFVFELYGLYLSHHFWHWSMRDATARDKTMKAFDRLMGDAR